MPDNQELTDREIEILGLISEGKSNKEIATALTISINTVKVHLRNIYTKLEVVSRTEAAMWAIQNGLITIPDSELTPTPSPDVPEVLLQEEPKWTQRIDTILRKYRIWVLVSYFVLVIVFAFLFSRLGLPFQSPPQPTLSQELFIAEMEETRWTQLTDIPTARANFAAAAYDEKIYAISGESQQGLSNANERYDTDTDTWESLMAKPLATADVQAGVIGGKIYIPGGRIDDGSATDIMEVYDPIENIWSTAAPLPIPLSGYALATFEGRLYVIGGWDGENYSAANFMYDPGLDRWEEKAPMPTARSFAAAVEAGGKIYVVGGFDGTNALTLNEVYDVSLDTGGNSVWSQNTPLPNGRYRLGVTRSADNIVAMGGLTDIPGEPQMAAFSTGDQQWSQLANPISKDWSSMGMVNSGTKIFMIGGRIDETVLDHAFSYTAYYTILLPIIDQ